MKGPFYNFSSIRSDPPGASQCLLKPDKMKGGQSGGEIISVAAAER